MPAHFAGLNFTEKNCRKRVSFVHQHRRKFTHRLQYFAHPTATRWQRAVDMAAQLGADALILAADLAMLNMPQSVTRSILSAMFPSASSATNEEAIRFFITATLMSTV